MPSSHCPQRRPGKGLQRQEASVSVLKTLGHCSISQEELSRKCEATQLHPHLQCEPQYSSSIWYSYKNRPLSQRSQEEARLLFLGSSESQTGTIPEGSAGSRQNGHNLSPAEHSVTREQLRETWDAFLFRYSLSSLTVHDGIPPNLHNPVGTS